MDIAIAQLIRVSKRVTRASGYLELDLPQNALDCLATIATAGPFQAEVELLRAEAFRRQRRYQDAAKSFKIAAQAFAPDRKAYLALSDCLRKVGDVAEALKMLGRARGANQLKL
jgi:tetratricopeptide (TPR) repeat protein